MSFLKTFLLAFCLFALLSTVGRAQAMSQEFHDGMTRLPSLRSLAAGTVYRPFKGNFSIALPYSRLPEYGMGIGGGKRSDFWYGWGSDEAYFMVICDYPFSPAARSAMSDPNARPDDLRSLVGSELGTSFPKISPVAGPATVARRGETSMLEFTFERGGVPGKLRVFFRNNLIRLLVAINRKSDAESRQLIERVFDSFQFMSKEARDAALEDDIKALTPAELPQAMTSYRPSTDARDMGLSGPVSGMTMYNARIFFDKRGDRIKVVSFNFGDLDTVAVFGVIDGMRISKRGAREFGEWNANLSLKRPPIRSTADERYSRKYVYFYDDKNRLVEEQEWSSSGQQERRTTYLYGEGTVEKKYYTNWTAKDTLIWSEKQKLDERGNMIESVTVTPVKNAAGKEESTTYTRVYKYETFDSYGNWTSRLITGTFIRADGTLAGPPANPNYLEKRTIAYHK